MIRELTFGDLEELLKFCKPNFPFPDINSGLYCTQKALVNRDKLVGAAMLKLTCEAVLIMDPRSKNLERAALIGEAFKELKKEGIEKYGLDQVHVFILPESDEQYAKMLQKHFGFQRATGIPLVYTKEK